ncbi:MAG: DNA-directed RNA polymerase sigma-70 factor [Lysobacteraceae bacterium]|nr:MAG: DNA-directed RNA polymerase sigma-70 factor [Xanthomonadaceae bacterium]
MNDQTLMQAHLAAARPQVIAALTRSFRDIDLAEDGFQEASLRALKRWHADGIPRHPTGWLVRVGRNVIIDRLRKLDRESALGDVQLQMLAVDTEAALMEAIDRAELRDDVLRLLFMCCHPDLTAQDQLALALKVVVGLPTPRIARAFVVKPRTMEQRLTRARRRAAEVAESIDTPTREQRLHRLEAVSTMVYLLFSQGYSGSDGDAHIRSELCNEAIRLARLLLDLFPSQPELIGLLALCLLQHARRDARMTTDGLLIPLDKQDRSKWHAEPIREGRNLVQKALRKGHPGPMQLQAAIAALHCEASTAEQTDWAQIEQLYRLLYEMTPSPIVALNHAVAVHKVDGADAALMQLDELDNDLQDYLYYHSTRAGLLVELGQITEARKAYQRALDLQPSHAEAHYLKKRLSSIERK